MEEETIQIEGALEPFGLTPEIEQKSEAGVSDYLSVGNALFIQQTNPQTRFSQNEDVEPGFSWADNQDYWNSLDTKQKGIVQEALSINHANKLLERNAVFESSLDKINNDPAWVKYPGLLATGFTDPINVVPIAGTMSKANSLWRASDTLSRMAKTGLIVGTVGAASNVASEALFDAQGLPKDYISSALFGFAFGGGLGMLGEGLSRTAYKAEVAASFSKENDPIMFAQNSDTSLTQVGIGPNPQYKYGAPKIDEVSWAIQPNFLKSDTHKLWESPIEEVRAFVGRLVNPTVATKDSAGNIVATKTTAYDKKIQWRGDLNTARINQEMTFRDAKADGYTGTKDQYYKDVGLTLRKAINEQELMVYEHINQLSTQKYNEDMKGLVKGTPEWDKAIKKAGLRGKEREEAIAKAYEDLPIKYSNSNQHINKAAESSSMYWNKMRDRGEALGMKQLSGISKNKGYMSRVYDFNAIRDMEVPKLKGKLYEAVKSHPANIGISTKELDVIVDDLVTKFKGISFDNEFLDFSYFVPKELPLGQHLKERKIKLNETLLEDLLVNNVDDLMGMYHYKTSGQMAIQWAFGTTNLDDIRETIFKPLRDAGAVEEIASAERVLQDTLGTLRMPKDANSFTWTATRSLTAYNSLTYGGAFGLNTLTEVAGSLWATGFKHGITKNFGKTLKGVKELLFEGTPASSKFINELLTMGHLQDSLTVQGMNRVSDTEAVFNASKFEHAMMGLSDKLFKYNGMRAITSTLEAIVGSNAINDIGELGRKSILNKQDELRLGRWGLTHNDAKKLSIQLDTHSNIKNGSIDALNLENWDTDSVDMLSTAVSRAIRSGVIQGDTAHLPNWMIVPTPTRKLLTQFLRFPIAAHETLLRRGWQEDKAGLAATTMGAIMTYASITYLREQAAIAAGLKDENDAKYDIFNDPLGDNAKNLITKSSNYASGLGAFTIGFDIAKTLSGKDYREASDVLGPTVGRLGAFQDVMKQVFEGDPYNGRGYHALKTFVPFTNIPVISEGISTVIEEETY